MILRNIFLFGILAVGLAHGPGLAQFREIADHQPGPRSRSSGPTGLAQGPSPRAAMEAEGATNSFMYKRAKAIAEGQPDPMPTSFPAAPLSISAA